MIMKVIIFIIILFPSFSYGQNLYIPPNAVITISDQALLHASGTISNQGTIAGINTGRLGTDLDLNNSGIIGLAVDSELTIRRNGLNDGSLTSSGTFFLGGNWINNGVSNFIEANIEFNGSGSQTFNDNQMPLKGMIMNSVGPVTLNSPSITISETLDFQSGILTSLVDKALILEEDAEATGGSETSYYDGALVTRGTGFKYYPVGNNGHFGPVEFDNIEGIDPEIAARHIWTNPYDPVPGDDLIGVSPNGLWSAEYLGGSFDGSRIFLDFMDEDLQNFSIFNEFSADTITTVVAYADSAGGVFNSLGVASLESTDYFSFGRILSDSVLQFSDTNIRYFALARAPLIPPDGVWYVPEVFSPNASNPLNQNFRFFGERISSENFLMRVYNRRRILVYETTDYNEATQIGWDGTNQRNGKEEPMGVYFYQVQFTLEPLGLPPSPENKTGRFYLIR